jgi:hypothetical protein
MRRLPTSNLIRRTLPLVLTGLAATAAGCANAPLPSLTTGSLFGSSPDTKAAAAAQKPAIRNDPLARTLQVSRIAARAQRCGYNFDPAKLKGNFLAAEGAEPGADVASLAKLDQTYTVTYNATLKAIMPETDYCSESRLAHTKANLTRHLAGDFTPGEQMQQVDDSIVSFGGGLFGGEKSNE